MVSTHCASKSRSISPRGLPQLATVGLPEGAVKESKDRIRAAVKNCGYTFPAKRITINLAPADIKKEGSAYDLPMAVGILAAEGNIEKNSPQRLFAHRRALPRRQRSNRCAARCRSPWPQKRKISKADLARAKRLRSSGGQRGRSAGRARSAAGGRIFERRPDPSRPPPPISTICSASTRSTTATSTTSKASST